mmetsp:Transcript_34230/g.66273  ORF Transcript_34230/g.66273 Transcript_34230/m.66273 type:complete len:358 (+) Transcript_34230:47-1120(+)
MSSGMKAPTGKPTSIDGAVIQSDGDAGLLLGKDGGASQSDIANPGHCSAAWRHGTRALMFLLLGCAMFALLLVGAQLTYRASLPHSASLDAVVEEVAPMKESPKQEVAPMRKDPKLWPSLFCFALMQPEGPEVALMKSHYDKRAGVFACNDQAVFCHGGNTTIVAVDGGMFKTKFISKVAMKKGNVAIPGQMTNSWLNVELFKKVFDAMLEDGRFWMYDWVVKVDPDAVFFPDRLRKHVEPWTPHTGPGSVYVRNCGSNPWISLMGAIEVFSKKAMQKYFDEKWKCESQLSWGGWGEDYYMEHCMNLLGVDSVDDFKLLGQAGCEFAPCTDSWRVAFHPFKTPESWWQCWDRSTGKY